MSRHDIAIVGGGMAGASLAAALAGDAQVVLIEAESQPGYHATGRSAAFWSETYGGPGVQPLTSASGPLLEQAGVLAALGSLHIARDDDNAALDAFLGDFAGTGVVLQEVDPLTMIPGLRSAWRRAVFEPSCAYIDVAALHARYLRDLRRAGGAIMLDARVTAARRDAGRWRLETTAGSVEADLLVDAAGAWADQVAILAGARPIGIKAYRRTMVQLRTDPEPPVDLPHVAHIGGSFYFKPEAGGRLWLSPHDEIASAPCDARPDEWDVALAIDRFESCVDWRVAALEHQWAGLRSFAPDRLPVYGAAPDMPGFFWFAGQGGFGIQTAPAAAALAAGLILDRVPDMRGVDPDRYRPNRFG